MRKNQFLGQQTLFGGNQDCSVGLHTYHGSKRLNAQGHPICKYCGADVIDWERIHRRNIEDVEHTLTQLKADYFRYQWWTREIDEAAKRHALRKGLINLERAASVRLKKSVGEVFTMSDGISRPYRDGSQTPFSGNSIFYAQHALACCCRKCMQYWHGVPYGRNLNDDELNYFTHLIMKYVRERLPEIGVEGVRIHRKRS
jgi:hypothetical protein